jgi:hypothetical protein
MKISQMLQNIFGGYANTSNNITTAATQQQKDRQRYVRANEVQM